MAAPFSFTLPSELAAKEPPERRGIARDRPWRLRRSIASG